MDKELNPYEEPTAAGKNQMIQIANAFDLHIPFNLNDHTEQDAIFQTSNTESFFFRKIQRCFGMGFAKQSAKISDNFPHNADIEINTGNPDTRFILEVDGSKYHHCGDDGGGMPLCNGSTVLQSYLIKKELDRTTDGSVLLRLSDDAVNSLTSLSDQEFMSAFQKIMMEAIQNLPEVSIGHYNFGEVRLQPLSYQYEDYRQTNLAQPSARSCARQEYACENAAPLGPH